MQSFVIAFMAYLCLWSVLLSHFLTAESKNPAYYNIGGVLSNNDSEFHFQETIAVRIL